MVHFEAFASLLVLIVLILFLRGPWRTTCTDYARQLMFECRDAIFDIAAAERISFESEAYQQARLGIERNIRFAHELSATRLIFFMPQLRQIEESLPVEQAINRIENEDVKKEISIQVAKSQRVLFAMMFFKSPILLLIGISFFLVSKLSEELKERRRGIIKMVTRAIQAESDKNPSDGLNFPKAA